MQKDTLRDLKSLYHQEMLNPSWEKTFWEREKVFSPRDSSILPEKRPFAWIEKSFRQRIDLRLQEKSLFPLPPTQIWA